MAKSQLLSSFGKSGASSYTTNGVARGLAQIKVDIEDTAHLSKYFRVVEFDPAFTAGKNAISFNGSDLLADGSEIKIEVLDSEGNSLYLTTPPSSANYVDIANYAVSIHVYKETANGPGQVILVGTTTKGEIVRWTGNISINSGYKNVSRVRFYNAPEITATPILIPVISNVTGSELTTTVQLHGNFGYSYTPTKNPAALLWSYSGSVTTTQLPVWNSEMIGANVHLSFNGLNGQHNETDVTILDVINANQVQITPINAPVGINFSTAHFTTSYLSTAHVNQAASVPITAPYVSPYLEIHGNSAVFTNDNVGETVRVNYSSITLDDHVTINPKTPSVYNLHPVTSSQTVARVFKTGKVIDVDALNYTTYDIHQNPTTRRIIKITGSLSFVSHSVPYQGYSTADGTTLLMQKSYVELTYRNLKTFTGYVARHKLYAKSNLYPGNYTVIDDTPIGPNELMLDHVTVNRNFYNIGKFANQDQINQYWFVSSASLSLAYNPTALIDAMEITPTPNYYAADGNSYIIAKSSNIFGTNDSVYYPYDPLSYSQMVGNGYASNFMTLIKGTQHVLSANLIVHKNAKDTAKIAFYFTSSSPNISTEKNYHPSYGYKLGEITVSDAVTDKYLTDGNKMFFQPLNDYHGTVLIVPYHCGVTISNLSIQNYGDYGFSPDSVIIQAPFPVNFANESWTLKSELFDSNFNLIYSTEPIVQSFDPTGASLYGNNILGTGTSGGGGTSTSTPVLTVGGNLYLPGISQASGINRFLGYSLPQHSPPLSGEGVVGYTNLSDVSLIPTNNSGSVTSKDYISVTTVEGGISYTGRSIALRYSGSSPNVYGRKVFIDQSGTKHISS